MRTIIIGGTFNPVHNGHLNMSEELKNQMGYERIIFIPSNIPAHKSTAELVSASHRIEMLKHALENNTAFMDLCEIERGGISYMIETVNEVKRKYEVTGKIGLFIGDDLIIGMKNWHNVEDLLDVVDIVVAHRESESELETSITHKYLNNVTVQISSSDIRMRIKTGNKFRYLIPEKVYNYIIEKDLYK